MATIVILLTLWGMPTGLRSQGTPVRLSVSAPSWSIIGPFPNPGGSGVWVRNSVEDPRDTSTSFLNLWGGRTSWHPYRGLDMLGWVNLTDHAPQMPCLFVARTYVYVPSTRRVRIELGLSGSARFFVNDSLLTGFNDDVFARNGSVTMACTLWQGWNKVHVRVGRDVMPFLSFALRLSDSTGAEMPDVTYSATPQPTTKQVAPFELLSRKAEQIDTTFQRDPRIIRSLQRAVATDTLGIGRLRQAAWAAFEDASLDTALMLARMALTVVQEDASLWLLKGLICNAKGMADSARIFTERSLEIDPGDIRARKASYEMRLQRNPIDEIPQLDVDSIAGAALRLAPSDSVEIETVLLDLQQAVIFGSTTLQRINAVIRINAQDSMMNLPLPKRFDASTPGWQKLMVLSGNGEQRTIDISNDTTQLGGFAAGDVIVYSAERWQRDSLFTRFSHIDLGVSPLIPTRRMRTSILIPFTDNYQIKFNNFIPDQTEVETPSGMLFTWEAKNIPAIVPEEFMPPIADFTPHIGLSTFPGWSLVIQQMQAHLMRRLQPCNELRAVVDSLLPSTTKWSPEVVARTTSRWVINSITLVPSAGLSVSPNRACDVLALRSGTASDKVILASTMMALRGVEALPTLVKTNSNISYKEPGVSMPFDHMILVLPQDSGAIMIDPSYRSVPLGVAPASIENSFAAPISIRMRDPVRLHKKYMMSRNFIASTQMSMDSVGWFTSRTQVHATDFDSSAIRKMVMSFSPMDDAPQDSDVRHDSAWMSATKGQPESPTCNIVLHSKALVDSTQDTISIMPRWMMPPSFPMVALEANTRVHPLVLSPSHDSTNSEIVITAPKGYTFAKPLPQASFKLPSITYSISSSVKGQTLRLRRTVSVHSDYVQPSEYPAFRDAHRQMIWLDQMPVRLLRSSSGKRR
ncbi:MAG: hypothetical protein FGM33_10300 [Candidatus Kapabacteria bacterium]|nr:hypothetical protein [Candidatus Kapabacteria bacterium]